MWRLSDAPRRTGLETDDQAPLRVRQCTAWDKIRESVTAAVTKAALKRAEDSIDAVVCAYIARFADARPDRIRVLGSVDDGYILTPVTSGIAARIDSETPCRQGRHQIHRCRCIEWRDGPAGERILSVDVVARSASYSSAAQRPWQAAVRAAVAKTRIKPRNTRFGVRVSFRTAATTNASEVWDLDNLIKPTLDAMEGIFGHRAWHGPPQAADDRVDYLQASKRTIRDGESPGAHIEVFDLGGHASRV